MWLLPVSIIVLTIVIAIPLSRYMAKVMDGKYQAPSLLRWFEKRLDSGPQTWKQYTVALLAFNIVLFVYGYVVLSAQPWMPLNPRGLGILAPTTIFHTVLSFITNTNMQHYSGDVAFSNFSQIFFCIANFFLSAAIGLCALAAIIRALRGDPKLGNFFVDMWRVVAYMFLPAAFLMSIVFLTQGMPMTYQSDYQVATLEPAAMGTTDSGQPKQQTIVVGPLAAFVPMKMMGTNGGGFYGMNSAHPFENPSAATNFFETFCMMLFPMALVLMYGRMLGRLRHAMVIFSVMLLLFVGTVVWTIYFDTMKPNPGLTAHPTARTFEIASAGAPGGKRVITLPAVAGLPVDQHLGNLEGKELRFGTSAGATFAAATVDVTCGAVNCEHDSLNPDRRALAFRRDVAQLHLRRQGRWHDQPVAVPDHRDLSRGTDGRPHARISGQENWRTRDEARDDRAAGSSISHPGAVGAVRRDQLGHQGGEQSRRAWIVGDRLPVLVVLGEQRVRLRRPGRELWPEQQSKSGPRSGPVGYRRRPGHHVWPLSFRSSRRSRWRLSSG